MLPVFLLLFLLHPSSGSYLVGRLREGQFEYSRLNGWMTPGRARNRCDRDPACGGFTYKGFMGDNDRKFDIYFFHLVLNYEGQKESWSWVKI